MLIVPIKSRYSKEIPIAIQIERINSPFTNIEEIIVHHLSTAITLKLEYEQLNERYKISQTNYSNLSDMISNLLESKSPLDLINAIRQNLPKFHIFENAELLYFTSKKYQLYTLYGNPAIKGSSMQYIVFPADIGISGEIVQTPDIYLKTYATMQIYSDEIDNLLSKKELHSFLFAPLFGSNGKLNGILQLINKKNKGKVTPEDIIRFKKMQRIYGLLIERALEKDTINNTLLELRKITDMLSGIMVGNDTATTPVENLIKSMKALNLIIEDMLSPRREAVIERLTFG